jgi:hypothetical protein
MRNSVSVHRATVAYKPLSQHSNVAPDNATNEFQSGSFHRSPLEALNEEKVA